MGRVLRVRTFMAKDVIFSCIYTNTTKLVLRLSYLVRLDYTFPILLINELLL